MNRTTRQTTTPAGTTLLRVATPRGGALITAIALTCAVGLGAARTAAAQTSTIGACTIIDRLGQKQCSEITDIQCRTSGGAWAGPGTKCPTGACITKDRSGVTSCTVTTKTTCSGTGGMYSGDGTNCTNLVVFPTPTATPSTTPAGWTTTAIKGAQDIAIGANGAVWYIDPNDAIVQLTASGPVPISGGGIRIAVDPAGLPWVVNRGNEIWKWSGSSWQQMPGAAIDIGIGGNGKVWILGTDGIPASWNGSGWTKLSGGGTRISVDGAGNLWVVNAANQIWRYANSAWQLMSGAALDVSAGPDGAVYVIGTTTGTGGNQVLRFDGSTSWLLESNVYGSAVAAGSGLHAYVARTPASGLPVIMR